MWIFCDTDKVAASHAASLLTFDGRHPHTSLSALMPPCPPLSGERCTGWVLQAKHGSSKPNEGSLRRSPSEPWQQRREALLFLQSGQRGCTWGYSPIVWIYAHYSVIRIPKPLFLPPSFPFFCTSGSSKSKWGSLWILLAVCWPLQRSAACLKQ